jgi:hypothetical protein
MSSVILTSKSKSTLKLITDLAKKLGVKVELVQEDKVPNKLSMEAIEELENGKGDTFSGVDELLKELQKP